jgi:hypothetical protein
MSIIWFTVVFRSDDFPEIRSKSGEFGRIPIFQFFKYFRSFSAKKKFYKFFGRNFFSFKKRKIRTIAEIF